MQKYFKTSAEMIDKPPTALLVVVMVANGGQ
jgi:hypothetical protein